MDDQDTRLRAVRHLLSVSWPGFMADACSFAKTDVQRRTMDELLERQFELMRVREFLSPLKDNPMDELLYAEQMRLRDRIEELEHALDCGAASGKSGKPFAMELKVESGTAVWVFRYYTRDDTVVAAPMVEAVAEFQTGMEAKVFMDRHAFMAGLECLT